MTGSVLKGYTVIVSLMTTFRMSIKKRLYTGSLAVGEQGLCCIGETQAKCAAATLDNERAKCLSAVSALHR